MVYKDPYMLELDAFSEGKHFMDMTHLPRRSPLAKPATVGQNGAAYVAALERTRMQRQRRRKRRNPSTGKHQSRYMHLKILKRE
jgi:hypothetical protein